MTADPNNAALQHLCKLGDGEIDEENQYEASRHAASKTVTRLFRWNLMNARLRHTLAHCRALQAASKTVMRIFRWNLMKRRAASSDENKEGDENKKGDEKENGDENEEGDENEDGDENELEPLSDLNHAFKSELLDYAESIPSKIKKDKNVRLYIIDELVQCTDLDKDVPMLWFKKS